MSLLGGDVDTPECSERVGDDLILEPPDCCVPHLLTIFTAILHRGRAASPVVVELSQRSVHMVRSTGSQTGHGVVVVNHLGQVT